jgi:hypothetical protein
MAITDVTISKIDLTTFFPYNKLFDKLAPTVQGNGLNSFIFYDPAHKEIYLVVKDSTSYSSLRLSGSIETDSVEPVAFMVNYTTIFDVLGEYLDESITVEVKDSVKISFGSNKSTSYFRITSDKDKLQLPHAIVTIADLEEISIIVQKSLREQFKENALVLPSTVETSNVFNGLIECLDFIGTDENKGNALALYQDQIITNDRRHIYCNTIPSIEQYLDPSKAENPIILHKAAIKMVSIFKRYKLSFVLSVKKDETLIHIYSPNFGCVLNNRMGNIKPPSVENLEAISSPNAIATIESGRLVNTISLFSKFYTNTVEFNSLGIAYAENSVKFLLQDSSNATATSCDIERVIETTVATSVLNTAEPIIYDSLKAYLDLLDPEASVVFYDDPAKPALMLSSGNRVIYIAKLISGTKKQ